MPKKNTLAGRSIPILGGATLCGLILLTACGQRGPEAAPAEAGATTAAFAATGGGLKHRLIRPQDVPAPHSTGSANNGPQVRERPEGAKLKMPPGFQVSEWATELRNPRAIAVAPNGDVFVAESRSNRVTVLRDADGNGKAETRSVFAEGLRQPFGIAFYPPGPKPTHVYIGNTDSVVRYPYRAGALKAGGAAQTIVPELPARGYNNHWTRRVIFRPDGKKLYVAVGSAGNVGEEEPRRGAVLEFNPDGSGYRIYGSGLRNPVGLAFHPKTNVLWTCVNERDGLGDDVPPEYTTSVKPGGFYGWPYYYNGQRHDPRMPERPDLKAKSLMPDVLMEAHSAPLGITFYTGSQFPAEYRNDAFVAMHGSWNRTKRSGYKIVHVPMTPDGKAAGGYNDFITGWALPDDSVWGRPVDVAVARSGALLISDDGADKIWRVTYAKPAR